MKRAPLFIAPDAIDPPDIRLTGQIAHRIQHTLRMRVGERVRISDGRDMVYEAELERLGRDAVEALVRGQTALEPEPEPTVEIVQVLPKPALADRILAPCTTLGVSAFRFAVGERTPVSGGGAERDARLERWRRIVRQAAEQCERGRLPACELYGSLDSALAATTADLRLVGDEGQRTARGAPELASALSQARTARVVQWIIGPEGGFSPAERARFDAWGLQSVGLGVHVMRLETAAVVATALTQYELGRMV